jgi:phosphomannomutase/phosphoglucomutase
VGAVAETAIAVPDNIFRAYDIRGIVGSEITPELSRLIGQAIGSEAIAQGESAIFVARDGRTHGPELSAALVEGLASSGCDVIDLGAVPTPLLYFATCEEPDSNSGVMLTASHNPADYNGFKVVINGVTLADDDIQALRSRIERNDLDSGQGEIQQRDILPAYIERIFSDVALAGEVKLVIDAGNGITGNVAPQLFEELGCEVIPLYCEVDGSFPNHEADPSREENLADLIAKVKETDADLGIALDGDGDRIGVVTASGQIIWPDRLLMLFAKDIVTGHPGCDVIFDVKSTRELNNLVTSYGGRPIMWKTGHSHMKAKMQETGALLGGELSGHIFIKERWYGFDDGMYAGTRLLEIMTLRDQSLDDIFASFPVLPATPELKIEVPEESKFSLIEKLAKQADFSSGKITTLDGIRVDFAKGWGLVRASNTSPCLTLRFEGETEQVVEHLQQVFKRELLKIDSNLRFPF